MFLFPMSITLLYSNNLGCTNSLRVCIPWYICISVYRNDGVSWHSRAPAVNRCLFGKDADGFGKEKGTESKFCSHENFQHM